MRSFFWLAVVLSCFSMGLGCAPRVRVKSNPGPHDQGIRYYRPKPYLLISNIAERVPNENGKPGRAVLDERYVDIQLQYLPDFEEEYAIDVRTGFGVADVAITLEDGWNLTAINQKFDSQTDENLKAAADLMGSVASAAGAGSRVSDPGKTASPAFRVKATNVPLGYYESVIGRDGCGRKRLYGFRYVGFIPYQSCPTSMSGSECGNCQSTEIYGLVFENDAMVFRPLNRVESLVNSSDIVERVSSLDVQTGVVR